MPLSEDGQTGRRARGACMSSSALSATGPQPHRRGSLGETSFSPAKHLMEGAGFGVVFHDPDTPMYGRDVYIGVISRAVWHLYATPHVVSADASVDPASRAPRW